MLKTGLCPHNTSSVLCAACSPTSPWDFPGSVTRSLAHSCPGGLWVMSCGLPLAPTARPWWEHGGRASCCLCWHLRKHRPQPDSQQSSSESADPHLILLPPSHRAPLGPCHPADRLTGDGSLSCTRSPPCECFILTRGKWGYFLRRGLADHTREPTGLSQTASAQLSRSLETTNLHFPGPGTATAAYPWKSSDASVITLEKFPRAAGSRCQ